MEYAFKLGSFKVLGLYYYIVKSMDKNKHFLLSGFRFDKSSAKFSSFSDRNKLVPDDRRINFTLQVVLLLALPIRQKLPQGHVLVHHLVVELDPAEGVRGPELTRSCV